MPIFKNGQARVKIVIFDGPFFGVSLNNECSNRINLVKRLMTSQHILFHLETSIFFIKTADFV